MFSIHTDPPTHTHSYKDDSTVIRMHVNAKGCAPYSIDMPRAGFLKNANARDIHTACGLYTLASNCEGALCAYVTHCRYPSLTPPPPSAPASGE